MSYFLKIKDAETILVQADNTHIQSVICDLYKDDEIIGERRMGYPLETTAAEIKADLAKVAEAMEGDDMIHAASMELQRGLDNAEAVKKELLEQ